MTTNDLRSAIIAALKRRDHNANLWQYPTESDRALWFAVCRRVEFSAKGYGENADSDALRSLAVAVGLREDASDPAGDCERLRAEGFCEARNRAIMECDAEEAAGIAECSALCEKSAPIYDLAREEGRYHAANRLRWVINAMVPDSAEAARACEVADRENADIIAEIQSSLARAEQERNDLRDAIRRLRDAFDDPDGDRDGRESAAYALFEKVTP